MVSDGEKFLIQYLALCRQQSVLVGGDCETPKFEICDALVPKRDAVVAKALQGATWWAKQQLDAKAKFHGPIHTGHELKRRTIGEATSIDG
jgi:hypothetical protein